MHRVQSPNKTSLIALKIVRIVVGTKSDKQRCFNFYFKIFHVRAIVNCNCHYQSWLETNQDEKN